MHWSQRVSAAPSAMRNADGTKRLRPVTLEKSKDAAARHYPALQTKPHRAALRTGIGCGQLAPQVLTARRMTCSARALWPGACAVPSVPQRRSCAKPIFCQPAQRLSSALVICPTPPCRRCAWRMAYGVWRIAENGAPLSTRLPARRTTPNDPAVAAVVGGFGLAQRLSLDGRTLAQPAVQNCAA